MIMDAQNTYSDAQALTGTGAVSTNVIDHGSDRDIGIGEPLAVVVTVDVALAGGGGQTYTVTLQSDSSVGFGSAVAVATSPTFAAGTLVAGSRYVLGVGMDKLTNRYTRLNHVLAGTTPTITVTAELQPARMVQAENVFATGFLVD
jgi:hypothetical protein